MATELRESSKNSGPSEKPYLHDFIFVELQCMMWLGPHQKSLHLCNNHFCHQFSFPAGWMCASEVILKDTISKQTAGDALILSLQYSFPTFTKWTSSIVKTIKLYLPSKACIFSKWNTEILLQTI